MNNRSMPPDLSEVLARLNRQLRELDLSGDNATAVGGGLVFLPALTPGATARLVRLLGLAAVRVAPSAGED
ncbi:hypothetical protein [Streptomyces aidingensis]|uniref:Uncharacterized protein n=1 Tax=Streptomyces aidingensis TaxID=910347 RepID=A0A1I1GTI2_9ACTN|nr:hypothetical protein [Streptomyces aidingensis]SFC13158.1 hypothetical protein SAMN05421773_10271 [Streptomyces aidingensis]